MSASTWSASLSDSVSTFLLPLSIFTATTAPTATTAAIPAAIQPFLLFFFLFSSMTFLGFVLELC